MFSAALFGLLPVVEAMLAAFPELIDARGPDCILLLIHTRAGGVETLPVLQFLSQRATADG